MSASLPAHITCPFPCRFVPIPITLPTAMPHSQCLYISQYAQFSIHRKPIIVYVYPSQFSFFLVISLVCSCTHNLSFNLLDCHVRIFVHAYNLPIPLPFCSHTYHPALCHVAQPMSLYFAIRSILHTSQAYNRLCLSRAISLSMLYHLLLAYI